MTDIFLWANQMDAAKNNLTAEFFLFNKNYTPYSLALSSELTSQVRPLFLYDMINFVTLGAGTGLGVREYEESDGEDNVLLHSTRDKVGRAGTLLNLIEKERKDIEQFNEADHEFKRMKGIIVKFSHPTDSAIAPFYAIKLIAATSSLRGATSWELDNDHFTPMKADLAWTVPAGNEVLVVGDDIFAFQPRKFERLFNYDYKKQLIADGKVEEIIKAYKLSLPDGLDLQDLVKDTKKVVNKLQKLEIGVVNQEQAVSYADDMQLDLMTDDTGAIIIMDGRDLDTFVNLINEDYMVSQVTGKRYMITGKRLLDDPEGEPPRG